MAWKMNCMLAACKMACQITAVNQTLPPAMVNGQILAWLTLASIQTCCMWQAWNSMLHQRSCGYRGIRMTMSRGRGRGGGGHKPFQELQVPTTTTFQVIDPTRLKSIQVHYLSTSSLVSSLLAQKTNQAIRHNKTPKLKGDLNKVLRLTYLLLKWKD
jgi:hypothetical protein